MDVYSSLYIGVGNEDLRYCKFCREVDANQKKFVERLREAIAIPSVSGQPQRRADVVRMVQWMKMVPRLYYLQYSDHSLLTELTLPQNAL